MKPPWNIRAYWPALLLVTVIPRLLGILWRSPWHDEYFTAWAATLPLGELVDALRVDSGPPLPYLLTRVLAPMVSSPLAAARLVSTLAATAAVIILGLAGGRDERRRNVFRWAAVLVAVHPLSLAWSTEGRAYALLLLASCVALWSLEKIERQTRGFWALGLAVAVACWVHALGLVLAFSLAAGVLLTLHAERRQRALLAVGIGLVSWLPWAPIAASQPAEAVEWLVRMGEEAIVSARLTAPVRLLPPFAPLGMSADLPGAPPALEALGVMLVIALVMTARDRRMWLLLGVPATGLGLASLLGAPVFYPGRAEAVYLAPFVLLAAGRSAVGSWRRPLLAACLLGWVLSSALAVGQWARSPSPAESILAERIAAAVPDSGAVVAGGHWPLGLSFHLERAGGRWQVLPYPPGLADHPGWQTADCHRPDPGDLAALASGLPGGPVAVVAVPGTASYPDLARIARRLRLIHAGELSGAVLFLPEPGSYPPDPIGVAP